MPTTPPTSISIETASICEYFVTGSLPLARQRTARANLAIRIDGQVGTSTVTGTSECVIRTESAEERAHAMRYMRSALSRLVGTTHSLDATASDVTSDLAPSSRVSGYPKAGS